MHLQLYENICIVFSCVSQGLNTCSVRVVYHFLMRPKRHLCRHSKITVASKVTLHSEVQTDFWKTARSGKSCVVKHSNVRKKLYWGYKAKCYTTVYEATAPSTRLWFFSSECDHWQSESLASQIYMMSRYQNHEISMSALSSYFHQECVWMYQQPHKESSEISGTNYGEKGQLAGLCLIDGPLTQNPYWVAGFSCKKLTLARGWNRLNIASITCFWLSSCFCLKKHPGILERYFKMSITVNITFAFEFSIVLAQSCNTDLIALSLEGRWFTTEQSPRDVFAFVSWYFLLWQHPRACLP